MTERDDFWLEEDELAAFMSLMSVNVRLTNILDAQLRDDAKLSFFEYTVLSRLSEAENHEMRMRDLAITANGSLSRLSQVVTRLEHLTDSGWDKVVETAPGHAKQARRSVIDNLTRAQIHQMTQINERIIKAIEADERYGGRY